ncbi:hypothetical protein AAG906_002130 [Vitis piasezkii]
MIHGRIIRTGLDGNLALSNVLIDMYSKCGNIVDSDLVSWTTMMIGYGTHGYGEECLRHLGLVDEGLRYFKLMVGDYNISPTGDLWEAYELIESMPFKPDECVWGHFLDAHGILDPRPNMAGTYVMLSNIYAADGKWGVCKTKKVDEKNGK